MKFLDVPQSGSFQANTHSHNRAGQYRRNRRSPVQPIGTGRRALVRGRFSAASQAWAALTDQERAAWSSYASEYPRVDRLGQSFTLTGSQAFIGIYASAANAGLTLPTDPPESNTTIDVSGVGFTVENSSGTLEIELTGWPTTPVTDKINVAFSSFVSAGVSFMKTFWQAGSDAPAASAPDLTSAYVDQFGVPPVGSRVFMRLTPVNQYGVKGADVISSAIVASGA